METSSIHNKFKLLFEKIKEPGYVLDNYYAEGLINKLKQKEDTDTTANSTFSLLANLIKDAFLTISSAHITVQVFLVRLLSIIAQTESSLAIWCCESKNAQIEAAFDEINVPNASPSLRVAYVDLGIALTTHNLGMKLLLDSGKWRNIFSLSKERQTVFVSRQMYKFAADFLWKLEDLGDETNLTIILEEIVKPFFSEEYNNVKQVFADEEDDKCKIFEPIFNILMSLFNESSRIHKPTIIMNTLINKFRIIHHVIKLLDHFRKESIVLMMAKLLFYLVVAKSFVQMEKDGSQAERTAALEIGVKYFYTINTLIKRRNVTTILDFCNAVNVIFARVWKGKEAPMFENSKGEKVLIQQQLVFIQLVPILVYLKRNVNIGARDSIIEGYVVKLLHSCCELTSRSSFLMRDLMLEMDPLSITLQSVKRLSCLKDHLTETQANLIFQALFYVLKDFDPVDENGEVTVEEYYDESEEKVQVMTYVMDTVLLLLSNYNINWQQSLEVICLYNVVFNVLKRPNLSCKFIVTSLKVITLTIRKFLPPNLSLLMESKPGSAMHELGQLIFNYMHSMHWEVRDSAMELLYVCTQISFVQFPPFQKQIIEHKLVNVAATVAFHEHELYVQASALKCIAAATKINAIWDQLKKHMPNVIEELLSILGGSQEGIVRKEVVQIFCDIYTNIKIPATLTQTLYEHMISIAFTDSYWEVQIAALNFWNLVIQEHLSEKGMLDGTFPSVTFSKESRKIVTLNDNEIQKRLLKALDELSESGCLTVLLKLLQDDTDIPVMDAALETSKKFFVILNQYRVPEALNKIEVKQADLDEIFETVKEENQEVIADDECNPTLTSDEVIESILNSQDVNLLTNIYERQMQLNDNQVDKDIKTNVKVKLRKRVTAAMFVNYINGNDFDAVIKEKRQWNEGIRSLSSLLDDILGIYEMGDSDFNTMDCY